MVVSRSLVLTLFNTITLTGRWPSACTQAVVSLLAKLSVPETASDSRPLTILTTTSRIWAKCMTSKLLVHLLPHLPPCLFGSVPGKSSIDLAFQLQAAIEERLYSGQPLVGVSMDLSKAYNTLSRPVLQGIMMRLGCPPPLWVAYSNFLDSLDRFFKIDHSLFGPSSSRVGVPEGCPIAVVCMIVVTWCASAHLEAATGNQLQSYVDNWSLRTATPDGAVLATSTTADAIDAFAMTVSMDVKVLCY